MRSKFYNKYNRKTLVINGISTSFIEKNLKHKFTRPVSWLNSKSNTRTQMPFVLTPIYSFPFNNDTILITAYTRLVLLYNGDNDVSIFSKKDINQLEYYKTYTESIYINEKCFLVLFEWIFDILHELDIHYKLDYNTVICDILFETFREFNIRDTHLFQGIATCAMFNILTFDNIDISLEDINYYTDNSYNVNDLEKYVAFQKQYLENNIV